MGRHMASNGFTLLIVALVVAIGLLQWARDLYAGPGPLSEETVIEVPGNANLDRVSDVLAEAGAIEQPLIFRIGASLAGDDERLKRGCFVLPPGASMQDILGLVTDSGSARSCFRATFQINARGLRVRVEDARLAEPQIVPLDEGAEIVQAQLEGNATATLRVSVAEGLTVREVLDGLAGIPFLEGPVPDAPGEGLLAPDTFQFTAGGTIASVVERMAQTQAQRITAAWDARAPGLPLNEPQDLLTLASIIEKETGVAAERRTVSGVFVNRLNQGWRLQTDPTIIYGITRGQEPLGREISRSDINGVTERRRHGAVEYNTYQINGLPPGPIANPGNAALLAAADPEATRFMFFVADGTGGHAFAETVEEHERNVAAYRAFIANQ